MVDMITAQHFRDWLETAQPGDSMCYHKGALASAAASLSRVRDLREAVQKAAGVNTDTLIHGSQCTARPQLALYFDHAAPRYVDLVQVAENGATAYLAIMRRDHAPHPRRVKDD